MTIVEAREIVKTARPSQHPQDGPRLACALGFIEGWAQRGIADAVIAGKDFWEKYKKLDGKEK